MKTLSPRLLVAALEAGRAERKLERLRALRLQTPMAQALRACEVGHTANDLRALEREIDELQTEAGL